MIMKRLMLLSLPALPPRRAPRPPPRQPCLARLRLRPGALHSRTLQASGFRRAG